MRRRTRRRSTAAIENRISTDPVGNKWQILPLVSEPERYTKVKAAETGIAERTLRENLQIAEHIASDVAERIASLPLADQKTELLAPVRLPEEDSGRSSRYWSAVRRRRFGAR